MGRKIIYAVALLCLFVAMPVFGEDSKDKVYTISVVPQLSADKILERWTPFLNTLEEELGVRFELKLYSSIPEFEKGFLKGESDIAYMNPYHAVMGSKAQGYIPVLRDQRMLKGILVVKKDGPVATIKDLDGEKLAFPAPNAFGASLYMRALLSEEKGVSINPVYVKTHSNVYKAVALGQLAAGGGVGKTFRRSDETVTSKLRVLYETPGVASHPIVVHPRVSGEFRNKLVDVVLALSKIQANREMLAGVQLKNPIKSDYDVDYMKLSLMGLDKYYVGSKKDMVAMK